MSTDIDKKVNNPRIFEPALAVAWSTFSDDAELANLGDAGASGSSFSVAAMIGLSGWIR